MGLKVKGVRSTVRKLVRTGGKTNQRALIEVRKGAEDIKDLAVKMAPVDAGNLENAIKVDQGSERGLNGRKIVTVYVDESVSIPGRPGKTVGDYAVLMHEGRYKLGKKSQDKDDNQQEKVGPKYIERAAEELADEITQKVETALKGLF